MTGPEPADLGGLIAEAAESNDAAAAENIIRHNEFIVFPQVDAEGNEAEEDDGSFSVMLAEIDEELAVVCFTNRESSESFAEDIAEELPEGSDLTAVILDGDILLDGLPGDCGLLVNPGTETECFFPPGYFTAPE